MLPSPDAAPAEELPPDHRRSEEVASRIAASRRRWKRGLGITFGAVFLALAAGEIVARATGPGPNRLLQSAGERGWSMKPGKHAIDGAEATISDDGTRGPATPGGILLLGDDIALGPGLADGQTAGDVLRAKSGLPVTVAACEGYGTRQELIWLKELFPRLHPRLVVVVFSFDDTQVFAATLFTRLRFQLQSVSALAASVFPGARPLSRTELSAQFQPDGIPWRLWEGAVSELGTWSRENKTPVLFAIWPVMSKPDDALGEYLEQVRGKARSEGLHVFDLRESFGEGDLSAKRLASGKPDAEAHRVAGEGLADFVKDLLVR